MRVQRNVGQLTALHLVRVHEGLDATTRSVKLDAEEKKRLRQLKEACHLLSEEQRLSSTNSEPEARIGAIDARVDRKWVVARDILAALGRLADELPLGEEAQRLERKLLPHGIGFTRLDSDAQLAHGTTLLDAFLAEEMSPALLGCLGPILERLREDHVEYAEALQARLVTVKRAPRLGAARLAAVEALQSFVSYVEVMADSPEAITRAEAILAPVDGLLERSRRSRGDGPVARPAKAGDDEATPPASRTGE